MDRSDNLGEKNDRRKTAVNDAKFLKLLHFLKKSGCQAGFFFHHFGLTFQVRPY